MRRLYCFLGLIAACFFHGCGTDTTQTEPDPNPAPDCSVYPNCLLYAECDPTACAPSGTPAIRMAPLSNLVTNESGDAAAFQIVLGSRPSADVVILFRSSDETEGRLLQDTVTFTTENWDVPQYVTIEGVDDTDADGDIAYTVEAVSVTSTDPAYNNMLVASVRVTNKDNEPRPEPVSITVTHNKATSFELDLYETGLADTFTIMLEAEPAADVTIDIVSSDAGEMQILTPSVTFAQSAWRAIKTIRVQGVPDGTTDGDQAANVTFRVTSDDPRYDGYALDAIPVTVHDTDEEFTGPVTIRMMAANTTSGNNQSYDPGHGQRIFQALRPDIVMIQEFNMQSDTIDNFVRTTFGNAYNYYRGTGDIPNGIISRYPITSTGQWKSPKISNRGFNWAVIDIPGDKDLLAISVHLSTESGKQISEMASLQSQIPKQAEGRYVVLGGDFNTKSARVVKTNLNTAFPVNATLSDDDWPCDQDGNRNTNAERENQYDYVLASDDLHVREVPIVIGEHTYPHGHVFDSRVYSKLGELDDVSPVQANDSGATNMQHMAVIRDFSFDP